MKYSRAQRLYALNWLDFDLIKAGEMVAITALELALKDRYAGRLSSKPPMLDALLRHLVNEDHLQYKVSRYSGDTFSQLS